MQHVFKGSYFFVTSVVETWILSKTTFFPRFQGGLNPESELDNMYKGYPLIDHVYGMKYLFLATLGYHLYRTYDQLTAPTRHKDFVEMILHHALTIILYTGSYIMNHISIGILVVYSCDTTDFFVHFAKASGGTKFRKSCYLFGLGMWICWFW